MALSQSSLRTILATIFSVDAKYIVPKQGNWFNPQDMLPTEEKPLTWVAFRISKARPRMIPVLIEDIDGVRSVQVIISRVDLQIVGTRAEELAASVSHWLRRQDVKDAFATEDAELIAQDFSVTALDFYQDGANNILSYNVRISVLWESVIEAPSGGTYLKTADITGSILTP